MKSTLSNKRSHSWPVDSPVWILSETDDIVLGYVGKEVPPDSSTLVIYFVGQYSVGSEVEFPVVS